MLPLERKESRQKFLEKKTSATVLAYHCQEVCPFGGDGME